MNDKARAFIGAGANLGEPIRQIRQAQEQLGKAPGVKFLATSSFYRTQPMGPVEQPPFVNAVFSLEPEIGPHDLLSLLLDIEGRMGRVRKERWGPRVIDLDLLFYGEMVIGEEGLDVPHPRLHERRFVLAPLAEVAPDFIHPVLKKTVSELLAELPAVDFWVEKLEPESP